MKGRGGKPAPADINPDADGFHIECPDVPGAYSWGGTEADALARGQEALVSILSTMISDGEQIPAGSANRGRPEIILASARCGQSRPSLRHARQGVGSSELGRLLGMDENAVRRLRDPLHGTRSRLSIALSSRWAGDWMCPSCWSGRGG